MLLLGITMVVVFVVMPARADVLVSVDRSSDLSPACVNQSDQLRVGLRTKKEWALRMMDAYGKPSAGILQQRLHWLGSYDECRSVVATPVPTIKDHPTLPWGGQYCLASLSLAEFKDKPSSIGVCFPEGCTSKDVRRSLEQHGVPGLAEVNLTVKAVLDVRCRPKEIMYSAGCQAVLALLSIIGTIVIVATLYDWCVGNVPTIKPPSGPTDLANLLHNSHHSGASSDSEYTMLLKRPITPGVAEKSRLSKILFSFSIKTSLASLTNCRVGHGQGQRSRSFEELSCLHAVRALSVIWIVLGGTCFYASQVPTANVAYMWEKLKDEMIPQLVFNSDLGADAFFVMGGLLASYLTLEELSSHGGKMNYLRFYFHRLWRLTPVYLLWLAIVASMSPHFGDGPLWPEEGLGDDCATTWWTNLLYINNFVRVDKPCMPWTWYLANDFQFYAISPIFILFLHNFPAVGIFLCWMVVFVSALLTGFISYFYHLPSGASADLQCFSPDFIGQYYVKPYCRAAPYFLGVLTGYVLHRHRCELEVTKTCHAIFSTTLASCCLTVMFATIGFARNEVNQSLTSFYLSVNRVMWGMGVSWLLFLCCTNNAGIINRILSWECWVPLSRLTYNVYLMNPVVSLSYYLTMRVPFFMSNFSILFAFIGNLIISFGAAFLMYIGFEAPMASLERAIFQHA